MRYGFHPEALAEYEAAALYYAERAPAVGQRFVAAVEDAIDRILDSPTRWRVLDEDVRRELSLGQRKWDGSRQPGGGQPSHRVGLVLE
jgi:plasmid stabilization system protein ParE